MMKKMLKSSRPNALNFSVDVAHELRCQKLVTVAKELVLKGKARITNDERKGFMPLISFSTTAGKK
jgi:hypothetical protein